MRIFAASVILWLCSLVQAVSHPHVFIDVRAAINADEVGRLGSLRITWVYDAFTSLTLLALLDLDMDHIDALSETDSARVVQAQTIWPDDFNGDIYLESAGKPVALGRPVNAAAEMTDGRIAVSFDLPLVEPLKAGKTAELRLYDPTYYYAYTAVEVHSSKVCEAALTRFEPDGVAATLKAKLASLSREETPEQDGVGRLFSDIITVQCSLS